MSFLSAGLIVLLPILWGIHRIRQRRWEPGIGSLPVHSAERVSTEMVGLVFAISFIELGLLPRELVWMYHPLAIFLGLTLSAVCPPLSR